MHKYESVSITSAALGTLFAIVLLLIIQGIGAAFPVVTEAAVVEVAPTPTPAYFTGLRETPEPTTAPASTAPAQPEVEPEHEPCYTSEDVEVLAKVVWAEARGLSRTEQAAVIWCVLNRVDDTENDYWPDTIIGVATQPNQFAYARKNPVKDEFVELAIDVLDRWDAEKQGCTASGRVLPKEYTFFFSRDTDENLFRTTYECHEVFWDWSLPSPYHE